MSRNLDNEDLPADKGRRAFRERMTPEQNPYREQDWQHNERQFGRDCEEQSNPNGFDWATGKFK